MTNEMMRPMLAVAAALAILPALAAAQPPPPQPPPAPAPQTQTISVERSRVLATTGVVQVVDMPLHPLIAGPGRVFRQPVSAANTTRFRLRFRIDEQPAQPTWHVEVSTPAGQRWAYSPSSADIKEFWSDEIRGTSAEVQVHSADPQPALKLVIDRVVKATPVVRPQSITMPDQREPYRTKGEPIRTLGRSVVRLQFVDDDEKKVFVCTGFLAFTNRHLLTNDHCINSEAEMRSALADVDFDGGSSTPRSVRFAKLLMSDEPLDFSLLELAEPLDRGVLILGAAPAASADLVIIQHPAGETKQVSIVDCKVDDESVSGITNDETDFEHRCDTLGGSSGSPMFDAKTLKVVGLHHLGFNPLNKPVNRAVQMKLVIAKINEKFPALVKPSGGTQP
jgi:hypothetical protein